MPNLKTDFNPADIWDGRVIAAKTVSVLSSNNSEMGSDNGVGRWFSRQGSFHYVDCAPVSHSALTGQLSITQSTIHLLPTRALPTVTGVEGVYSNQTTADEVPAALLQRLLLVAWRAGW